MEYLKEANIEVLNQLGISLQQLNDTEYSTKLEIFSNSSIGMHVRHILEFYGCFLSNNGCNTCYDDRKRELQYEVSVQSSLNFIEKIIAQINHISENLSLNISYNTGTINKSASSSLARELLYLVDHTIHHMALIKIGFITKFPNVVLPENYGVAPSTIRFIEKCAL